MPSLLELVDRVNRGELVDSKLLQVYQASSNSAERFLGHHASAMVALRSAQQYMLQSLEAIEYGDQKVLAQFISVSGFLGLSEQRAAAMVRFGANAIARREYALGLEAIQSGVAYDHQQRGDYTASRENCRLIAAQYVRAAQCIGWTSGLPLTRNNRQTRIAYLVSSLADDEPAARTARSLARHYDSGRFRLHVYSTKAAVRRDKQQFAAASYLQPSTRSGEKTLDFLDRQRVPTWLASTSGTVVEAARHLADQLVKDRIDMAIFDATQADAIAAVVAEWEVTPVKMNLCRGIPLYASGLSCVAYTDQARYEADHDYWRQRQVDCNFILEGIDADEDLGLPPQRSSYGIPSTMIVLASAGPDLDRTVGAEFVEAIINLLRLHPQAVYLMIGDAELSWQKRKFESAGIAKRIGHARRRKDVAGFLRIADIYLAEFPANSAASVVQAMSVEKPVVAMCCGNAAEQSQAAALVGSEGAIPSRDPGAYIERIGKLIGDLNYRQTLGGIMRSRVRQHFNFAQTARQLEQLCDQLIHQARDGTAGQLTLADDPLPMAKVA